VADCHSDGVRVLDLTDGAGAMSGRLLADLGADVVLVEPSGGARLDPRHRFSMA
jgi:crotonobetainyl-CoA:carnitine CoA-transferase CaiB-like acyl-CoA transferase